MPWDQGVSVTGRGERSHLRRSWARNQCLWGQFSDQFHHFLSQAPPLTHLMVWVISIILAGQMKADGLTGG